LVETGLEKFPDAVELSFNDDGELSVDDWLA